MKAMEASDKLPIGYSVKLMKMCEGCDIADLKICKEILYCENAKKIYGTISCENIQICERLCEMHEEDKQ